MSMLSIQNHGIGKENLLRLKKDMIKVIIIIMNIEEAILIASGTRHLLITAAITSMIL
jgi:hypothetical protein